MENGVFEHFHIRRQNNFIQSLSAHEFNEQGGVILIILMKGKNVRRQSGHDFRPFFDACFFLFYFCWVACFENRLLSFFYAGKPGRTDLCYIAAGTGSPEGTKVKLIKR